MEFGQIAGNEVSSPQTETPDTRYKERPPNASSPAQSIGAAFLWLVRAGKCFARDRQGRHSQPRGPRERVREWDVDEQVFVGRFARLMRQAEVDVGVLVKSDLCRGLEKVQKAGSFDSV